MYPRGLGPRAQIIAAEVGEAKHLASPRLACLSSVRSSKHKAKDPRCTALPTLHPRSFSAVGTKSAPLHHVALRALILNLVGTQWPGLRSTTGGQQGLSKGGRERLKETYADSLLAAVLGVSSRELFGERPEVGQPGCSRSDDGAQE